MAALFLGLNANAAPRMDMVDVSNNNGLNMTTLASRNGKSIYTTIYPGQRSVVR